MTYSPISSFCDNIAPAADELASVNNVNGSVRSGDLSIGYEHNFSFNDKNASFVSADHLNIEFFVVSLYRGDAISAKFCKK